MKKRSYLVPLVLCALLAIPVVASAKSLTLYAAGSLKAALGEVVKVYETTYNAKVTTKFAPSGLLRKAIEGGEAPDVFASANMAHPMKLADAGWGTPVALFARNKLCAIAQQELQVTTQTLYDTLMDTSIRLGTSTPKADPSGDYAWKLFKRAEAKKAGSFDTLANKAMQLTGGPESKKAPQGHNTYGWVMGEKQADVFLTYCTNAVLAQKEVAPLQIVQIPEDLSVGADYGLLVKGDADADAWRLAMFILSPAGQEILSKYGFDASAVPNN